MKNKRGKVLVNFAFSDVAGFKTVVGSWALIGDLSNFDEEDGAEATFEGGYVDGTVVLLDINDHHHLIRHAGHLLSAFSCSEFRNMQADGANIIMAHGPVVNVENQQRCVWVVAGTEESDFPFLLATQIIQATTPLAQYADSLLDMGGQDFRSRAAQPLINALDTI